jgi:hypothetical protein
MPTIPDCTLWFKPSGASGELPGQCRHSRSLDLRAGPGDGDWRDVRPRLTKAKQINVDFVADVFILAYLWAGTVAFLFGFASTIGAAEKETLSRPGNMACAWALVVPVLYAIKRWIL